MSVYELSRKEIYDSYAGDNTPPELIDQGRTEIATRLQVEEGLGDVDAYYAADELLAYARALVSGEAT